MQRTTISGTSKWFDKDKSRCFRDVETDNERCRGGSRLYLTVGGVYVLERWSLYDDTPTRYEIVKEDIAIKFLLEHGHYDHVASNDLAEREI